MTEEEVDVDSVKEKFVKKVFPDKLSEALPIVYRAHKKMKENKNTYAEQFESWAERLSEGTWHIPETDEEIQGLADLLRKPIPAGVDGMDAQNAIRDFIGDDGLFDDIEALAEVDPEADVNSLVVSWLDNNMPEVLEQIKELSPDGFVRDQGRQQEKPKDWAQAVAADESIEEGKMKDLSMDLKDLSDEEFEEKYGMKKSDWDEVKTPGLRMDPNKPAYISKNLKEEDNYPEYLGFQNDREYFKSEHEQYCMQCNHLSHIYAEHGENPDIEGEADVVCPNCGSGSYFIATDEEIEKYGPAKDELPEGFNPMVPGDSSSPLTYAKKAYCDDDELDEAKPDFLDLDKDGDKEEPMKKAAKNKEEMKEENPDYSKYDEPTFKRKNPQPKPEKSGWAGYNMDEPAYKRKQEFEKQKEQLKKLAGLN